MYRMDIPNSVSKHRRHTQMVNPVQTSLQVQSDQFIPVEDIHGEMSQLEKQLDELEQRGVELEKKLRDNPNGITLQYF